MQKTIFSKGLFLKLYKELLKCKDTNNLIKKNAPRTQTDNLPEETNAK